MDLLPKHMCHRCSYKLEEFHKFYVDCLKTDTGLKNQLSWMQKEDSKERVGVPMVHIENIKIKVEPPDYDMYGINPIVGDVGYINSMSSVTFPMNSVQSDDISERITYTAYTRCSCYCDKSDQSNETVPTNYKNKISRCSRTNEIRQGNNDSCANEARIVKKNFLSSKTFEGRSNLVQFVNEVKDADRCRPTSSNLNLSNDLNESYDANKETSKDMIVRNLRPRRNSINYLENRRKLPSLSSLKNENKSTIIKSETSVSTEFDMTQIKIEKLDNSEGRILRPRNGTINYRGPIRKYSKSTNNNQRLQSNKRQVNKKKVLNITNELKLPLKKMSKKLKNEIKLKIKEEESSDLKDLIFDESVSVAMLSLSNQIDSLPEDYDVNIKKDNINHNALNPVDNFSITNWKSLRNISNSKLKAKKFKSNRLTRINYSLRHLRSQDVCLRNGKIRNSDNADISVKKLPKSLKNLMNRNKTSNKTLMKTIRNSVTAKMSASMKMIDIKHYCEECNTSFANKELFKLHACYGH